MILDKTSVDAGCCDPPPVDPAPLLRAQATSAALCGILTLLGWILGVVGPSPAGLVALVLAYAAGGWGAARRSLSALRRGSVDVDLLMVLAAVGAATVGHWLEGAILLFLFSSGNALETYAFGKTRRSIQALMELRPSTATRLTDGGEETVALDQLRIGDRVRVRPAERVAVDGTVVSGSSRVDESTLTGEPSPVLKEEGDPVFAGTLNGTGSLEVQVSAGAEDTTLARVIRMVEDAQETKAPTQSWIEDVEGRYAVGVIGAAIIAIFLPWLALGWSFEDSLYRAMTLLVVASPCALVISIPATIVSAVSNGARRNVLFKGGSSLDALSDVKVFAVDKTGTLTVGRPTVTAVFTTLAEPEVLRLAAAAESHSEHPLARAIVRAATDSGVEIVEPDSFDSVPGHGIHASVSGRTVAIGRPSWVEKEAGKPTPASLQRRVDSETGPGATRVTVSVDAEIVAVLAIDDAPRVGVRESLDALRASGVEAVAMLTGDAEGPARYLAEQIGIDEVRAGLLPEEKKAAVAELRERYGPVAMVGDGVNDAPALAAADVGVAIGAAGTDVALETADVVMMGENLEGMVHAVQLSHRARTVVRQNLIFSVGVMATLVVLALTGRIGLTLGVVGHEGSTIIVVLNGLRLLAGGHRR